MQYTNITFKLTDGSLFSLPRRVKRHTVTLLQKLTQVKDGRSNQGKRHSLENILAIMFCGMLAGCLNLQEIAEWAVANRRFLKKILDLPHGIPHPTTISYALQLCDIQSLVAAYLQWREIVYGVLKEESASFDGKTMRAVHGGDNTIRHILSLLTHDTLTTIGQVGVDRKENEIPAARRLFQQIPSSLLNGITLIGDALHAQIDTAVAIRKAQAHYLLIVKGNQEELMETIAEYFLHSEESFDTASDLQYGHGSRIKTIVTVSHESDMLTYLSHWKDITTIGRIHRRGTRTYGKKIRVVDEIVYFVASTPKLDAIKAVKFIRNHWKIENNLHRTKDVLYLEDQQTLRLGTSPQVMTFMRSMVINLFTVLKFSSISKSIRILKYNRKTYHDFMQWAAIM